MDNSVLQIANQSWGANRDNNCPSETDYLWCTNFEIFHNDQRLLEVVAFAKSAPVEVDVVFCLFMSEFLIDHYVTL